MNVEEILLRREMLLKSVGATLRCINSDTWGFEVGKDYKVGMGWFAGLPDPIIGKHGFSLNGYDGGYYKVEGSDRVMARFKMIKDSKGRYVKRARIISNLFKTDSRRNRRMARQALKVSGNKYEIKVLKEIARNAGK